VARGGSQTMALQYDFDMVAITPEGLPDKFGDVTITGMVNEKVAMFRDPETVAAITKADEAVRTFLTESGFALQQFDSGAPPGRFPMQDDEARIGLIERLSSNLQTHDLSDADWGQFDFSDFMDALSSAKPMANELLAPTPNRPRADSGLAAARIAAQKRKGRRLMALGGLMLGLVLLLYVASQTLF